MNFLFISAQVKLPCRICMARLRRSVNMEPKHGLFGRKLPWWNTIDASSAAVAALNGRWWRIATALIAYDHIYKLENETETRTNLVMSTNFAGGRSTVHHKSMPESKTSQGSSRRVSTGTDFSRPSPTAIMRLLSPSHSKSFL